MHQSTFVGERKIFYTSLITNEVVEEDWASRNKGLVSKLDFEKAYDREKWSSLDKVMVRKNCDDRRSWIT